CTEYEWMMEGHYARCGMSPTLLSMLRKTAFDSMPTSVWTKYGFTYSQTTSFCGVTWNIRPNHPSVTRVLPLGNRRAPEMFGLKKFTAIGSRYSHTIALFLGSTSITRENPWVRE